MRRTRRPPRSAAPVRPSPGRETSISGAAWRPLCRCRHELTGAQISGSAAPLSPLQANVRPHAAAYICACVVKIITAHGEFGDLLYPWKHSRHRESAILRSGWRRRKRGQIRKLETASQHRGVTLETAMRTRNVSKLRRGPGTYLESIPLVMIY